MATTVVDPSMYQGVDVVGGGALPTSSLPDVTTLKGRATQPANVVAQARSNASGQTSGPPTEAPYQAVGASGRSSAALTVQSEPSPHVSKPPFDPRPYALIKQHNPDTAAVIDDAARLTGTDPSRIAWHAWKESRFRQNTEKGTPLRGGAGEIGMMQLLPSTANMLSANGKLDPFDPRDNILMGARYIAQMDSLYGQNSPSSFAAYNGGPNGVKNQKAQAYAASAFPGSHLKGDSFLGEGSMSPRGLIQAGSKGGPDEFLRYAVDTAPRGMPVTDVWRRAEALLVSSYLERGDVAGAQHARDFVLQMSHAGSNQYLMAAHQAMSAGDGVGAAQYLAKSHAFFPDGTIGRFRTNGKQVYAERLDEHDPSKRIGDPFMVGPDDIAGLLNQTSDPQRFLKTLNDQQANATNARLKEAHGDYYAQLPQLKREEAESRMKGQLGAAAIRSEATQDAAQIHAGATIEAANIRSQNKGAGAGNAGENQLRRLADKETSDRYNQLLMPDTPAESLGELAEIHHDARMMGATPPQAERVARGLSEKTLQLMRLSDGSYGVIKAGEKNAQPIALLSQALGDRLGGVAPQQGAIPTTPIGAGAQAAGVTSNLAGSQVPVAQSSALPVRPQ